MSFFPGNSHRSFAASISGVHSQQPSRSNKLDQDTNVRELETQCARLHMQVQTLARLLIAKGIMEEGELDEWMEYVDNLDGVADGRLKVNKRPQMCKSCNRANSPKAVQCQWCGEELPAPFLDPGAQPSGDA